jgi:hypothetical protein
MNRMHAPSVQTSAYRKGRSAMYTAKKILEQQGYEVVLVSWRHNTPVLFHLIAWNQAGEVLFIKAGKYPVRRKTPSLEAELAHLCASLRTGQAPGELQYWMQNQRYWARYRILPGGAVLIREDHALA